MTDTSREALIKRLRTETWSGFQSMAAQAADMLEADASRITELEALSVTNLLLDVVPGDGSGLEVFAKSTSDVVALLSKMGEKIEDFESSKWAQQVAVPMPMSDSQISNAWESIHPSNEYPVTRLGRKFARAIEAHHGIGAKP